MASKTLGRIECPIQCGHTAAHVKIKTDKASAAFPYIHCRNCGAQLHTKNDEQAGYLLKRTRPEALDTPPEPAPTPTPTRAADAPPAAPTPVEPTPAPPAPAPRRRFAFRGAA